jgi:uncharacterized membrane protein YeaQ/YmgE (transglycosylase-associated protein family)
MMGIVLTSVLGIAGALIGGLIASQLFNWDTNTFSIAGFAVAVAGALVLLFLYHMVNCGPEGGVKTDKGKGRGACGSILLGSITVGPPYALGDRARRPHEPARARGPAQGNGFSRWRTTPCRGSPVPFSPDSLPY